MDLSPKEADPNILRMFDHNLFISISIAMAAILTSQVLRKTGPPSIGFVWFDTNAIGYQGAKMFALSSPLGPM